YFVMAEFALLTMHRARFEQTPTDGDNTARRLPPAIESPGSLLLTIQIGSSLSTVAIGFVIASASLEWMEQGALTRAGAVAVALAVAGLLHASVSSQLPK